MVKNYAQIVKNIRIEYRIVVTPAHSHLDLLCVTFLLWSTEYTLNEEKQQTNNRMPNLIAQVHM